MRITGGVTIFRQDSQFDIANAGDYGFKMSREYVLQPFRAPIHFQIDYAKELNEQQYAAVTAPPGPALVIAGAGSGKTRTLTYRVAYLLEQGIPAERILLLTFTNKAAKEMMRRVADLLEQEVASLWGGTFHSVGNRILRLHADLLGYHRDFTILDREDAKHLITACVAESEIDTKAMRFPKADVLGDIFSLAVNTHKSVVEILSQDYDYFSQLAPKIAEIQQRYAARKKATNAMDFDDLLALWLRLIQKEAEVRETYQRRFQFVLVDEMFRRDGVGDVQREIADAPTAGEALEMVVVANEIAVRVGGTDLFKNPLLTHLGDARRHGEDRGDRQRGLGRSRVCRGTRFRHQGLPQLPHAETIDRLNCQGFMTD